MCWLLEVSEREEGIVALHLPNGPLKSHSRLELVLRCEPSTYQPINSKILVFVSERKEGIVALHLPHGPLKKHSRLELVLRCEPSTYQPINSNVLAFVSEREEGVVALHLPIGPLKNLFWFGTGTEMRTQYPVPTSLLTVC